MTDDTNEEASGRERRQHERKIVQVNKLLRAKLDLPDGSIQEAYMYLVDVSEGGMRVNVDSAFPEEPVRMRFELDQFVFDAQVHPSWQKCLVGGTWTVGLDFRGAGPETIAVANGIIDMYSPDGRRKRFKLREILNVMLHRPSDEDWLNVLAIDVSSTELQLRSDHEFPQGSHVDVKIFPPDLPRVEAEAEVLWQREVSTGRFEFRMKFLDLTKEGADTLQKYIDRAVGLS